MKLRAIFIILVGLVLILSSMLINEFLPDWRWPHHPFHAVIEGLGAFIAIVVATMILSLLHHDRISPTYVWVASALAGMGILDGFHAGTHAGQEFVWLHSIATLIGGVIFALVWIPDRITESLRAKTLTLFIGAAATVFALLSLIFPDALPVMVTEAGFTLTARFANILGGVGFLAASSFFFFRDRGQVTKENIILSNHCFLFGISAIIFEFSVLWDGSWWLWHSLRLISYLVVLYYFLYLFNLTQATISRETKALKESEERYRDLYEKAPVAYLSISPVDGSILRSNSMLLRMLGYDQDDLKRMNAFDFYADTPDGLPAAKRLFQRFRNGESIRNAELQMKGKDGDITWVTLSLEPVKDAEGNVLESRTALTDITELKRQAKFVELLQKIAAASNEASLPERALQICVDEVCAHTGWPVGHVYAFEDGSEELVSMKIWHLDHGERFETFRRITEQTRLEQGIGLPGRVAATGQPVWITDVTKDDNFPRAGLAKDIHVKAGFGFPVLIGNEVVAVLEFFSEEAVDPDERLLDVMGNIGIQLGRVVERSRTERRNKFLGELAASLAHELNQPLTVIRMAAEASIERLEGHRFDAEYLLQKLRRVRNQAGRAAEVIDHVREFGRKAEEPFLNFDPGEVVQVAIDFLSEQLRRRNIEVRVVIPENCRNVLGRAVQLEQVVVNLVINARDAIEANRKGDEERRKIILTVEDLTAQDEIKVKVKDTGGGIPNDILTRIFEPFFTTKKSEGGTGLGLSISSRIISDMGGTIEAANHDDGAEFTITLPAVNDGQSGVDRFAGQSEGRSIAI